jgi:hypothetical protein
MKTLITALIITVLIFCAHSCSPRGDGSVTTVEVNGSTMFVTSLGDLRSSNVATIPLSSLVESMELVQLEDHDDAFFRSHFTTVTANHIGVRQQDMRPYLLFDRSGRFLGNIGSVGQGPGEYQWLYDDIIDDKNGLIYLTSSFGSNRILVYNTSGALVREITVPIRLTKPKIFLSDNVMSIFHMTIRSEIPLVIQFDINTGQKLSELVAQEHFIVSHFGYEIFNTRNVSGVFDIVLTSVDTLFHYDVNNNRLLPFFTMTSREGIWKNYFQVNRDLVMTRINIFDENAGSFINRGTVATDLRNMTSSYVNVVNDFFGNLPVEASVVTFRNGYFVYNVQPEELMDEIENRLSQSNVSQRDRQQLEQLLSKLEEDTNNVVFIGKLRDGIAGRLF